MVDEGAVRRVVDDVVGAMLSIPRAEAGFPQGWWPGGCCEPAAIAISGILEDRGLGRWELVNGHHGDAPAGHMWLEWAPSGTPEFSIDVTLHQFPHLADGPFVGLGVTPAAAWFDTRRGRWFREDWPWIGTETEVFLRTLDQVRGMLKPLA